jgi:uncharacterized DUF497 family protein
MDGPVSGFDWDDGNRAKCREHGVSPAEIEALFERPVLIVPDEAHSTNEERLRAIGRTVRGRSVFLVFTIRERDGERLIRPISARYMHRKEVASYEKENPGL